MHDDATPQPTDCDRYGHDYSASRTVDEDAFATKRHRQFYCTFCGADRPRRNVTPTPSKED